MFKNTFRTNLATKWHVYISYREKAQVQQSLAIEPCYEPSRKSFIQDMCELDPDCAQPKVVIIGAGLAGLSAAHRLITCGIKKVVILEARDRPGGRIWTKTLGDSSVDLGVSGIVGACSANPTYNLACLDEAIPFPVERLPENVGHSCFDSTGRAIKHKVFFTAAHFFNKMKIAARSKHASPNKNLFSYFSKKIQDVIPLFPKPDQKAAEMMLYSLANDERQKIGIPLNQIPLNSYGMYKVFPGGMVAVHPGMSRLLNPLLRVVTPNRIKYNKIAEKIMWSQKTHSGPRVVVGMKDNTFEDGDYVIVTIPLGVLKETFEIMFDPPLSQEKIDAINCLELAHKTRIILKYKNPFWIKGEGVIRLGWNKEEVSRSSHWTNCISTIEECQTANDILFMVVSGPEAIQVESMPACEVAQDVTNLLRKFLENGTIPMPSQLFRTKWRNDPFSRGSSTYLTLNTSEKDLLKMARPLAEPGEPPVVLFAGDSCVPNQSGLCSARVSGIMEAERILKLTKCFCGPPPNEWIPPIRC